MNKVVSWHRISTVEVKWHLSLFIVELKWKIVWPFKQNNLNNDSFSIKVSLKKYSLLYWNLRTCIKGKSHFTEVKGVVVSSMHIIYFYYWFCSLVQIKWKHEWKDMFSLFKTSIIRFEIPIFWLVINVQQVSHFFSCWNAKLCLSNLSHEWDIFECSVRVMMSIWYRRR